MMMTSNNTGLGWRNHVMAIGEGLLAWSTVAVTLHADGRCESELVGASPFPRHWVYDHGGSLVNISSAAGIKGRLLSRTLTFPF